MGYSRLKVISDFNFLFDQLLTKSFRTLGVLPSPVRHREASQITKVLLVWLIDVLLVGF